eukprot:TRINITY_DN14601_c1_g1_i1.p1 TRINITY_DN14601_c1_g1~~TRINITY_DN14601_c1_g1_i1.p1  ORF type:complete len:912 (+),score=114.70 TRINITY_DN14601_c1_g1_i1:30-2765(+)
MLNEVINVVVVLVVVLSSSANGELIEDCETLDKQSCDNGVRCNNSDPSWISISHCKWDDIGGSCNCNTAYRCENLQSEATCSLGTACPNSPRSQCYWNPEEQRCLCNDNGMSCSTYSESTVLNTPGGVACPEQPSRTCVWDPKTKEGVCKTACTQLQTVEECLLSQCPEDTSRNCIWAPISASSIQTMCRCADGTESCSDYQGESVCNAAYCSSVGQQYNKFRSKCSWDIRNKKCQCRGVHYTPTTCNGVPKSICTPRDTIGLPGLKDYCPGGCEISQITGQCSCKPEVEAPTSCDQIDRYWCTPEVTKSIPSISKRCASGCQFEGTQIDSTQQCRCVDEPLTHCRDIPIENCTPNETQTPYILMQCPQGCGMRNGQCRCLPGRCEDISDLSACPSAHQIYSISQTCKGTCYPNGGTCACTEYATCSDVPLESCGQATVSDCEAGCVADDDVCFCSTIRTPCDDIPLASCTLEITHKNTSITQNGCKGGCHSSFGTCMCINYPSDFYVPLFDALPAIIGSECRQLSLYAPKELGIIAAYVNDFTFGLLIYSGSRPGAFTEHASISFDFGKVYAITTDSINRLMFVMFRNSIRSFDITDIVPKYLGVVKYGFTVIPSPLAKLALCSGYLFFYDAQFDLHIVGVNTLSHFTIKYDELASSCWFDVQEHPTKSKTVILLIGNSKNTTLREVYLGNSTYSEKALWSGNSTFLGALSVGNNETDLHLVYADSFDTLTVETVSQRREESIFSKEIKFLRRYGPFLAIISGNAVIVMNNTDGGLKTVFEDHLTQPLFVTIELESGLVFVIQRTNLLSVLVPNVSLAVTTSTPHIPEVDNKTDDGGSSGSSDPTTEQPKQQQSWSDSMLVLVIVVSIVLLVAVVVIIALYRKRSQLSRRSAAVLTDSEMMPVDDSQRDT